jgi:sulfite reductase (NADPH) flavoprotein alpha-component
LTRFHTQFNLEPDALAPLERSRISPFTYVQHLIKRDATIIAQALGQGATVMICGGKAMAAAVEDEFQTLCVQANIDFHALKSQGRFKQVVF